MAERVMIRLFAVGAVVAGMCVLPASAQINSSKGTAAVLSNGQNSCGEFLAGDRQSQAINLSWILGYITGANSRGQAANDRSVGGSFRDPEAATAWVQQYCRSHAFDYVFQAAEALREEFAKREGRR
jgi:hypothetical protein